MSHEPQRNAIKKARRRLQNAHANLKEAQGRHAEASDRAQVALFRLALDLSKLTAVEEANPAIRDKISLKKVLLKKEKMVVKSKDENAPVDTPEHDPAVVTADTRRPASCLPRSGPGQGGADALSEPQGPG